MTLEEMRKALAMSREDMTETLTARQPVAKLEKRAPRP